MFLLTKDQATNVSSDVKKCTNPDYYIRTWWLSTPDGDKVYNVSCVYGTVNNGSSVDEELGVRPALKLVQRLTLSGSVVHR